MHFVRILAAACLVLGSTASSAQSSAPAADPLDPRASVQPPPASNVLAGYVPLQAQAIAPWRESNAQVTPMAGKDATLANAPMQMRAIEFIADNPGDWAFHCHKSHHTMNAMGHQLPTMIGVKQKDLAKRMNALVPEYMAMGEAGMADIGGMEMPLPDNTLPMMTGQGPFGPIEMGGMFTVLKVRAGLGRNDYRDPGWYRHPKGTVAFEYTGTPGASQ